MKKIFIKTFGCQMNVYDSNRILDLMIKEGYQPTDNMNDADLIVVNTCHIRDKAAEKSFSELGRYTEKKKANQIFVLAGCVVQAFGDEILKKVKGIDYAVGPGSYHLLPEMIKNHQKVSFDFCGIQKFAPLPPTTFGRISSFLAIQEGCDNFCSYCVVPYTRGCEESRPLEDIISEAQNMVKNGTKEIMLLGQNVNGYHGLDQKGKVSSLADVIRHVSQIKGLERIRYTTSYPSKMTDDIINCHRDCEKLMPYVHLPIQAGSDNVLKAMNRKYTVSEYLEIVERFRSVRPDIAISSDFIVGFPGESDTDFEQTLNIVKKVKYAQSYSFKYSPRPGTVASTMDNQIDEHIKTKRLAILQEEILKNQKEFNHQMLNQTLPVLFDEFIQGQAFGYTPYLQKVHINASNEVLGKILNVKIVKTTASSLTGEIK